MNATKQEAPERQEIEALLPWHAAGTLSRRDAQRVVAAEAFPEQGDPDRGREGGLGTVIAAALRVSTQGTSGRRGRS